MEHEMNEVGNMLLVKNLHATVDGKSILQGLDFTVNECEFHSLMGPNGSGKSTFANVLAGHDDYTVKQGEVTFLGEDLLSLSVEERAHRGLFLAFQYPVEIPGVNNTYFLKAALNAIRKAQGLEALDALGFMRHVRATLEKMSMDDSLLKRSVNCGFSGGEMKRNEVLQMALLEPKLAILDETDSRLDIDALRTVAAGVNKLRDPERAMIIVTHYQRLLDYIEPDFVHVISAGKIVLSGDKALALELEARGYGWITDEEAA